MTSLTHLKNKDNIFNNIMNSDDYDISKIDIYNFNTDILKKEYNFITETSKNINNKLIIYAEKIIERGKYVIELSDILNNLQMAIDLELGIFEYALIHVTVDQLIKELVLPIYLDKFNEICLNLREESYIKNKTLKPSILSKKIGAKYIAFMTPEQLHPEKWTDIINKRQYRIDKEQNLATTDLYKCYKCGERKCKVAQFQTRSSDEPITSFITCVLCLNTWIL
jgi:DNA-directed RNA polymerase subunit M/transcription elongation factor TFIIS